MKKIITIFILLFILTSCGDNIEEKNTKYYSTATVLSGSITISNSFVGYVKGDEMVDLATKVGGKVTNIYIKEGDFVEKGDTLVTLDSLEAKVGYSAADSILNSLFEMRKSTSDMFDDQIEAMNAKVEQVKEGKIGSSNGLDDTKKITSSQLSTSKAGVDTAKANLDHTKIVLETKEKHIYDNSKAAIVGAVILDTNIINFVDVLLGITEENESKNDSYEDYLSAKNIKYLREAEIKFEDVKNDYDIYKEFYDSNIDGKEPSIDDIKKGLKNGELLAEKLKSLLSVTYNVLDSSIENIYLPVDTISSYKTKISDLGVNIESSLITVSGDYVLGLKGSKQGLEDFDKAKDMELELLSKQLILAEKTYDQYLAISEGKINEVETMKNISSSQLDEILAGLESLKNQKKIKLNEIDSKINEAKGQKDTAGVMINNGKIVSPISGIITSKNVELGQVVGGGIPVLSVSNKDNLVLDITVSEEQSKKIKLYDEVDLKIEGKEGSYVGIVTNILTSKDIITKKVGVEISIDNTGKGIQVGSFTKAIFKNLTDNNGIIIPNSSIINKFMVPGVYVINNGVSEFKNIEIIKQNDRFSEIKGLEIGDTIITDGKENIWDGEKLK